MERILVLYTVLRDIAVTTNQVGLIRVSALIPLSGGYDDTLADAKDFIGQVVPLMFEPAEEPRMLITSLVKVGAWGYLVIALAFAIPLAMIVYASCVGIMTRRHAHVAAPLTQENDSREEAN